MSIFHEVICQGSFPKEAPQFGNTCPSIKVEKHKEQMQIQPTVGQNKIRADVESAMPPKSQILRSTSCHGKTHPITPWLSECLIGACWELSVIA